MNAVADAASEEGTKEWAADMGVEGGALKLGGIRTSVRDGGRAFIFEHINGNFDFQGANEATLTFQVKSEGDLIATALHLLVEAGPGNIINTLDLQTTGINSATWTEITIPVTNISVATGLLKFQFNLAAGAVENAGGTLYIDNLMLTADISDDMMGGDMTGNLFANPGFEDDFNGWAVSW